MSINLTTGFSYSNPETSLEAVFAHLHGWRAQLRDAHQRKLAQLMARDAARIIDRAAAAGLLGSAAEAPGTPMSQVRADIEDRQRRIRASGFRDPEVDFDTQVVIFPTGDIIMGMVFCEQPDWIDALLDDPMIEPKPYWDSSDRPDTLTDADWVARRAIWMHILDRDPFGRPAQAGLSFEMSPPHIFPNIGQIVSDQPSFESRVDFIAREAVLARALAEEAGAEDALQMVIKMQSQMDSPKGRAARASLAHKIAPLLAPHLSAGDFSGK